MSDGDINYNSDRLTQGRKSLRVLRQAGGGKVPECLSDEVTEAPRAGLGGWHAHPLLPGRARLGTAWQNQGFGFRHPRRAARKPSLSLDARGPG